MRGVTLLGAYFGIWPDDLASLSILGRRIEELGVEGVRKKLSSWVALVGLAGQEFFLLQTYRAAFAIASAREDANATSPPQIQARWFTSEGQAAALLLLVVAGRRIEKSPDDVVALYCDCGGICDPSQQDWNSLLIRWFMSVNITLADQLVLQFAGALFAMGRFDWLVCLFEAHYSVYPQDYFVPEKLQRTLRQGREKVPVNRGQTLFFMMAWATGLHSTDRMFEAVGLLDSLYPGLTKAPVRRYEDFRVAFQELPAEFGEHAVFVIARTLFFAGRVVESRRLIEKHLKIIQSDYKADGENLRKKLTERRRRFPGLVLDGPVYQLGQVLQVSDRPEHAVLLLQGYLGVDDRAYQDETVLRQWVQTMKQNGQGPLLPSLSSAYVAAGKHRRAVRLIELLLGLNTSQDYAELSWLAHAGEKLGNPMAGLAGVAMPEMVNILLKALKEDGQTEKYHLLLGALDRDGAWLKLSAIGDTPPVLDIALHLLDYLEVCEPVRSLSICTYAVGYLRRHTTRQNLAASDRLRLAAISAELRRRIIALGNALIVGERDPQKAEDLRRQFLCWDAELGHRMLLDRFLYACPAADKDGGEKPVRTWACQNQRIRAGRPPQRRRSAVSSNVQRRCRDTL